MDWIHCNLCYFQPGLDRSEGQPALSLTSCGHLYCDKCLPEGTKFDQCKICKNRCKSIPLTGNLQPDVQDYFTMPGEILSCVKKIMEFQNEHRLRLTAFNVAKRQKMKQYKKETESMLEIIRKLRSEVEKLRVENKSLNIQLQAFKGVQHKLTPPKTASTYVEGGADSGSFDRSLNKSSPGSFQLKYSTCKVRMNESRERDAFNSLSSAKKYPFLLTQSSTHKTPRSIGCKARSQSKSRY